MNREKESAAVHDRIGNALASLRSGNGVLVVDDADRENEGDLIFPAETLTDTQMAMLIRECSGIVCLCLTPDRAAVLRLHPMVAENTSRYGTAFTCSIEASSGVTTGVSAQDRVATIKAAVAREAKPEDLNRPGHVFPLVARPGGVLERSGHTEATVDLMRLAGFSPAGVLCELTLPDGRMAKMAEIEAFSQHENIPIVSVADIVAYRQREECA
ncbi:MAG: 3,4-dihydroxy-2-butanone-4-phosphate synthase [Planctomycetes bacterium]|nr:3,4-dihydroxy-2-butanone-4-phosphate synthase [Planctomycetota bacterium]